MRTNRRSGVAAFLENIGTSAWLAAIAAILSLAATPVHAQQLIANPGAEVSVADDDQSGDDIADWVEAPDTVGGGVVNDWLPFGDLGTTEGTEAFALNPDDIAAGTTFNLQQDIAGSLVSGGFEYTFSADLMTIAPDEVRAIVEYRDGSGTVLESYDTGFVTSASDQVYDTVTDVRTAPTGTSLIRVRLQGREQSAGGSGDFVDAYADNLSLEVTSAPVTAGADDYQVEMPDDLTVSAPGLLDNDFLGSPAGDIASFGGGDLGGGVGDNAAGNSVGLAGGTLTVSADGSMSLTGADTPGTYSFDYSLSNGSESDSATVTVQVFANNLLANPSAELSTTEDDTDGDAGGDDLTDWVESPGTTSTGMINDWFQYDGLGATDGTFAFVPYPGEAANGTVYRLYQDVSTGTITGGALIDFSADLKTVGADEARVMVEFRNGSGTALDTYDSGFQNTGGSFTTVSDSRAAPSGTDSVRVILQARETGGSDDGNDFTDAAIENLILNASGAPLNASDDGTFAVPSGSTLGQVAPGLLENDSLGSPAGSIVSFGGGDLGGSVTDFAPGDSATLAGGTLTVESDGSFTLDSPVTQGTFSFEYRLGNGSTDSDAVVSIQVQPATGNNLLINPSAENTAVDDDAAGSSDIADWVETPESDGGTINDWLAADVLGTTDGGLAFVTETEAPSNGVVFNLQQDVGSDDVTPGLTYAFSGDMRTDSPDEVRMRVEYLDSGGAELEAFDTGFQDVGSTWQTFSDTRSAPAGSETIRVRLQVREQGGSTNYAEGAFDDLSLVIENSPPEFVDAPAQLNLDEDAAAVDLGAVLAVNDPDPDQTLTWTVLDAPDNGTLNGFPVSATSGGSIEPAGVSFQPDADFAGSDAFEIQVGDGTEQATITANVSVSPVNDAPSVAIGGDQTVAEDSGAASVPGFATGFDPGGGADESGQAIAEIIVGNDNNALFSAQPAIDTGGTLTYTPAPDASGQAEVNVAVRDDGGTANGGEDTSATASFTISVSEVNDQPVVDNPLSDVDALEDAAPQVFDLAAVFSDVEDADTDLDFAASVSSARGSLPVSVSVDNASDELTLTFEPDAWGDADVSVSATDSDGASVQDVFAVSVDPVNDAPSVDLGGDQSASAGDGPQEVPDFATGFDPGPGESGQAISEFVVSNDDNALFSVQPAIDSTGRLSYTPAATADGTATVSVQVRDDGGTANGGDDLSAVQTFTIDISATADLSLTLEDEGGQGRPGDTFTYLLAVSNQGPSPAEMTAIDIDLANGLSPVSTTGCAEDPDGVPTCSLGTLAAGQTLEVSVQVEVTDGVGGQTSATVSAEAADPVSADNEQSLGFSVIFAVPVTGPVGLALLLGLMLIAAGWRFCRN